jgi:hypothetical protein
MVAVSGADATKIGSGYQNTVDINAQAGNVAASSAAVYAFDYSNNGKTDWHLPSRDELNELRKQHTAIGIPADYYWSSSEYSATSAVRLKVRLNLNDGDWFITPKSITFRVRPVRAFLYFASLGT